MSDYGEFCKEQREHKQALRRHWHECPHCKEKFGTGTLTAPGHGCKHSKKPWHPKWKAPGDQGDDQRAVEAEAA